MIARKQNFKNSSKSLAERCQLNDRSNFADENPKSHPLFSTERKYGVLNYTNKASKVSLRLKLSCFGLLPGVTLRNVYSTSWMICHEPKFSKDGVIMHSINETLMLPIFSSIKEIWVLSDFIYFECMPFETVCFGESYQAYQIKECPTGNASATGNIICAYENLVNYNVFHVHNDHSKNMFISVKYHVNDLMNNM